MPLLLLGQRAFSMAPTFVFARKMFIQLIAGRDTLFPLVKVREELPGLLHVFNRGEHVRRRLADLVGRWQRRRRDKQVARVILQRAEVAAARLLVVLVKDAGGRTAARTGVRSRPNIAASGSCSIQCTYAAKITTTTTVG